MVAVAVGIAVYLRFGAVPVATADKPFPFEKAIVQCAAECADREPDEDGRRSGPARTCSRAGRRSIGADCAACHGTPGHDVAFAQYMYPDAPQLWKKHAKGNVVGVSDDEPGETYWKVANGIRLTGMPAYEHVLTDTQMWQVTLLLKNADQQLPDPVMRILMAP